MYNGGDALRVYDSPTIIGHVKVKLLLKDEKIRTLPSVLHILDFNRNLIYVSTMSDACINTILKKYKCKMIQGEIVLMRGVLVWNSVEDVGKHCH